MSGNAGCEGQASEITIAQLWSYLLNSGIAEPPFLSLNCLPPWPPDAFGLVAAILKRSGAYTRYPFLKTSLSAVQELLKSEEPRNWFLLAGCHDIPAVGSMIALERRWGRLWAYRHTRLSECSTDETLIVDMLWILAAADEASIGIGLPFRTQSYNRTDYLADDQLEPREYASTLSRIIHPTCARVLPKIHTSQRGFTLRSFSHHICYVEADEVRPLWYVIPSAPARYVPGEAWPVSLESEATRLNVLVVPVPEEVKDLQFVDSTLGQGPLGEERGNCAHGFFRYEPLNTYGDVVRKIIRLVDSAISKTGAVDLVVLPEVAITAGDYVVLRQELLSRQIMLITGIGGRTQEGTWENRVAFDIPLSRRHAIHLRQRKHHRWALDKAQIQQYSLGNQLGTNRLLWEDIDIGDRHLHFVALRPWLIASVLICEDLARHDPVSELLRGIGPNLVFALLMDGPQIKGRWPDRSSAVLSDDPGSSVLSVTSLGMSSRSRPRGRDSDRGRVIALWRDSTQVEELSLATGASALLLTVNVEDQAEWTADMRLDRECSFYPVLSSVLQIEDTGAPHDAPTQQVYPEVKFLSPGDASALGRIVQILETGQDLDGEALLGLMARLSPDAHRIAGELYEKSFKRADLDNKDSDRTWPEGLMPDPRKLFENFGMEWAESQDDSFARETAESIRHWYLVNNAFKSLHDRRLAEQAASFRRKRTD